MATAPIEQVMAIVNLLETVRSRVTNRTTGLFKHARYPLERTLSYPGDPGLFGPESITWPVIGDAAAFIGGLRALIIQTAHPEVAAGVSDHSSYRTDPLGRLSRTSAYVTATSFGAMPEVEMAAQIVRNMHKKVQGISHRGITYTADTPQFAAWVHNALTDSFLVAHQYFGQAPLSPGDADRFVEEQTQVGALLDADPLPATAAGISDWITNHPAVGPSPALDEAMDFLRKPPLPLSIRIGYRLMFQAAVATIPVKTRRAIGVRRHPGAIWVGRALIRFLRWALGSSPSWNVALVRVGADIPDGLFHQPLPVPFPANDDAARGR
jgi:uncharacterized protein (DUF2236 family)